MKLLIFRNFVNIPDIGIFELIPFIMEEQTCPRCKTTKYRNPSLKLMVNVCGHSLCESCVDLLFLKGSTALFFAYCD